MRNTILVCVAISASLSLPACQQAVSPAGAQSVSSPTGSFAHYHTFTFRPSGEPPAPYQLTAASFEVERRITDLVEQDLTKRGYARSDEKADLLIRLSSGRAKVDTSATGYQSGQTPAISENKGVIVMDAFDASTMTQVWHGSAESQIDPATIDNQLLQRAVDHLVDGFPAGAPAAAK
jgi:Domain of unknown function (DUF4136)